MIRVRDVLEEARAHQMAIGHFNPDDFVTLKAIFTSARELNVPVIVGVSEGERQFRGDRPIAPGRTADRRQVAFLSPSMQAQELHRPTEGEPRMSSEDAKGFHMRLVQRPADPGCPRLPDRISIEEFGRRHNLDDCQIRQLRRLFGPFADKCELWANVRRPARYR